MKRKSSIRASPSPKQALFPIKFELVKIGYKNVVNKT